MTKVEKGGCNVITCNYCEEEILEKTMLNGEAKGWTYGTQGTVIPTGPVCFLGYPYPSYGVKHACPKPLCQAKLLVWTKS